MSNNNTHETEQLIIKLLKKLERKGKNIQSLLWRLMDEFDNEEFDEKTDEKQLNNNEITLLYDASDTNVCKVGHKIEMNKQKHLLVEPCVMCGHRNNNKMKPNHKQTLQFLNNYNTNRIPFGPDPNQKAGFKEWENGYDKEWPLHYAAISGDIVKINQLSKNQNINIDEKKTDYYDITPITYAARCGQLKSVIELIKHGANAMPPPDKSCQTPYKYAYYHEHEAIIIFFQEYIKHLYNFEINNNTNLECYKCYIYDLHFNKRILDGTMSKYVYCKKCTVENVKKVNEIQENNKIIEKRIVKTIKENASISVDTLCQMKDAKALHSILKEIMISGEAFGYSVWLIDIDNFKQINSHLTHAIADTKLQALGEVLKQFESRRWKQWNDGGYGGIDEYFAFRQGGDEFALVVGCNWQQKNILQKLYETLRNQISKIKLANMKTMEHMTVSIGVCFGHQVSSYEEMMKKADEAAESVKKSGKNGIAIYAAWTQQKIYKNFNYVPQ